jgi:hypothetical protein
MVGASGWIRRCRDIRGVFAPIGPWRLKPLMHVEDRVHVLPADTNWLQTVFAGATQARIMRNLIDRVASFKIRSAIKIVGRWLTVKLFCHPG